MEDNKEGRNVESSFMLISVGICHMEGYFQGVKYSQRATNKNSRGKIFTEGDKQEFKG